MKNKLIIIIFTSLFLMSCGGNYSGNEEAIIRSATSYRFVSGGDNGNESVLSLHSSNSNAQTTLCKFRVTKTINGDYNEKDTTAIAFIGDN